MAAKPLPDQALLLKLLRYDPETGKLYWRERTAEAIPCAKVRSGWNKRWAGKEAFTANSGKGYLTGCMAGFGTLRSHRVIWMMCFGQWPEQIDHLNQDKSDNRLANLKDASREENARNCPLSSRNKSGRIGVHWSKAEQKWRAKIRHGGRYIYLGHFHKLEDACEARSRAEREFGYNEAHGAMRSRK